MTQNTLFWGIYGDGWKNHNMCAWRAWSWASLRWENIRRKVEPLDIEEIFLCLSDLDWPKNQNNYVGDGRTSSILLLQVARKSLHWKHNQHKATRQPTRDGQNGSIKKDGKLGKMVLLQMAVVAQVATVLGSASQVGSVFLGTGLGLASLSNWIWRFRNIAKRTMDPRVESFCQSSSK